MGGTMSVEAFLRAPLAMGLLLVAEELGDATTILGDPTTATAIASAVMTQIRPWSDNQSLRRSLVQHAVRYRALVTEMLQRDAVTWLAQPLERQSQAFLTESSFNQLDWTRAGPRHQGWETYAQRPANGPTSSTAYAYSGSGDALSGLYAELASAGTDWFPAYPLRSVRATIADTARIYEINGPSDWHTLVSSYADFAHYRGPDSSLLASDGIDHGPGPSWDAVAAHWDGVHISFFGWITSSFVKFSSGGLTTTAWSWRSERTYWLNNIITGYDVLDDVVERPLSLEIPSLQALMT